MLECTVQEDVVVITNPCNDETINFNVKIKDCHTENFDRINLMITGQGTGNYNNEYVYSTNLNQNININSQEGSTTTIIVKEKIIGKGEAPSFTVKLRYIVKINPDGNMVVFRDIIDTECKQALT